MLSFIFYSCLEGIPLEVFKKSRYYYAHNSLKAVFFYGFNIFRQCVSHDADAYLSIGRTKVV